MWRLDTENGPLQKPAGRQRCYQDSTMRFMFASLLASTLLIGCAAVPNQPTLALESGKSPEEFTGCVMPILQAQQLTPLLSQGQRHSRISLTSAVSTDKVMDAYKAQTGSKVFVFERSVLSSEFERAAKDCA